MDFVTIGSFLFFTALVAVLTWWITRKDETSSATGYFLAGRSLTFPLIAGSLLLTNLSTEQMVGLNGNAFTDGFCVMVWEVVSVISMVAMAWFFLPRFLKSGVATVPEFLNLRFDKTTEMISNLIFLAAYVGILLPMILYTGARGMSDILDVGGMLKMTPAIVNVDTDQDGIDDALDFNQTGGVDVSGGPGGKPNGIDDNFDTLRPLVAIVWVVGILGSLYALFGGLKTVAVSDTLNGIGLLIGGLMITYYALSALGGDGGMAGGWEKLTTEQAVRMNSIGSESSSVPFGGVFSGIFLLTLFYWATNQQIIQRTLAASSLAEGQKGVLLTGAMKLLGPLYLVIPGMIAYSMFSHEIEPNRTYGLLVRRVLPSGLTGFFAAAMLGAILSSFNSALNSSCTLFSLGLFKNVFPKSSDRAVVLSGQIFGVLIAIVAMLIAPQLNSSEKIFDYLQKMNGLYAIPILAVVLVAMLSRRVPPIAAKFGLIAGFLIVGLGNGTFESLLSALLNDDGSEPAAVVYAVGMLTPLRQIADTMGGFYFTGTVFAWLVILMFVIGAIRPTEQEYVQEDANVVDMTPWQFSGIAGVALIVCVITIYAQFADFGGEAEVADTVPPVVTQPASTEPAETPTTEPQPDADAATSQE